jgi:hypothetical protein
MKSPFFALTCVALAFAGGCTVHQAEAPPLTGPSEFALSVTMTASPDTLVSGGQQQSSISVQARDAGGGPKANQSFQLYAYTIVEDVSVPIGTLSTDRVVTGADGRATAIYTMPNFSPSDAGNN